MLGVVKKMCRQMLHLEYQNFENSEDDKYT